MKRILTLLKNVGFLLHGRNRRRRAMIVSSGMTSVGALEQRLLLTPQVVIYYVAGGCGKAYPETLYKDMETILEDAIGDGRISRSSISGVQTKQYKTNWNSPDVRQRIGNPCVGNDNAFVKAMAKELELYKPEDVVILIGHSWGGDSLLKSVAKSGAEVDLLAVLDPVSVAGFRRDVAPVNDTVRYLYNRWQTNSMFPINFAASGAITNRARLRLGQDFGIADQDEQNLNRNRDGSVNERHANPLNPEDALFFKIHGSFPNLSFYRDDLTHGAVPSDGLIQEQLFTVISGLIPQRPSISLSVTPASPVNEGTIVVLDASSSVDPNPGQTGSLSYSWRQLSGANTVSIVNANSPIASFSALDDAPSVFGGRSLRFELVVTDSDGLSSTKIFKVDVSNVAPRIDSMAVPARWVRGFSVNAAASFSDPGIADTHTASWLFGDSSAPVLGSVQNKITTASHIFSSKGVFNVSARVSDDDGGQDVATRSITVVSAGLLPDPLNPGKKMLAVGGTTGDDIIRILPSKTQAGSVDVVINGTTEGSFRPDTRIVVAAQAGSDSIYVGQGDFFALPYPISIVGGEGLSDLVEVDDRMSIIPTRVEMGNGLIRAIRNGVNASEVTFDETVELVRVNTGSAADIVNVHPSVNTQFDVKAGGPGIGGYSVAGDFLQLDPSGTDGRHLVITETGKGFWTFTSGHKNVYFESIERFNHVDVVAIPEPAGKGSKPLVRVFDAETKEFKFEFLAYEANYEGGVSVAVGDVNEDGLPDIVTAPGRLHAPEVRVFDGTPQSGLTGSRIAGLTIPAASTYGATYSWGVNVAVGDVNGDGGNDIVTAPRRYVDNIKVFQNDVPKSGLVPFKQVRNFDAFADLPTYIGGANIAVADLDGELDGNSRGDIIVGNGSGIAGQVRVFDVALNAAAYSPKRVIRDSDTQSLFGLYVAAGDIDGNGNQEIFTSGLSRGKSFVKAYSGAANGSSTPLWSHQAFTDLSLTAPAWISVNDFDFDGNDEFYVHQMEDGRNASDVRIFEPSNRSLIGTISMPTQTSIDGFDPFLDTFLADGALTLTGVESAKINPVSSVLSFNLAGTAFSQHLSDTRLQINGVDVSSSSFSIQNNKITAANVLVDGKNQIFLKSYDVNGRPLYLEATVWAGSRSVLVSLNSAGKPFTGAATVTVSLSDDPTIVIQGVLNAGKYVFSNLPDRTFLVQATATGNLLGLASIIGSQGTALINLTDIGTPSAINNNDISQGTIGWTFGTSPVTIIPHVEGIPAAAAAVSKLSVAPTAARIASPAKSVSIAKPVALKAVAVVNNDLNLSTSGEGSQTLSRTFDTKEGTTEVHVRYRFITSEVPGGFFGSEYNDTFSVSARALKSGDVKPYANSMNGLGLGAFDFASGATKWFDATVKVNPKGDTVKIDVSVTNVGDGELDSQVVVDFVEEDTPQIKPSLSWDSTKGGLKLDYTIQGEALKESKTLQLYWAIGDSFGSKTSAIAFSYVVPAGTKPGSQKAVAISGNLLKNAPDGTTHLLIAASEKETSAIKDVKINPGAHARSDALTNATLGIVKDSLRAAGQSSVTITSTVRTPEDQARAMFNNLIKHGSSDLTLADITKNIDVQKNGDGQFTGYGAAGDAVIDVFASAIIGLKAAEVDANRTVIEAKMIAQISKVPGKGHRADPKVLGVLDISAKSFSTSSAARFVTALKGDLRVKLIDERKSNGCFHLEIAQSNSGFKA